MTRLLIGLAAVFSLAACGELDQTVNFEQGKYQGKPDTRPWDNPPPAQDARGVKWTQGDRESWKNALHERQLTQHEDRRLYP